MDKIEELLMRGVERIVPSKEELEKVLRSGKTLNLYLGIDPTSPRIHLGHAVPLRKLQALVEIGHEVTFLIGDFTAFIGDTSDKNAERPALSEEQIMENWQTYKRQAEKILDFTKVKVVRNSEWLDKVNFRDVIRMARHFSLNDFISRELIRKRLDEGGSVNLAEVLYPLAQGMDSWHLKTDLQIGGTEQIFNIQAGRTLIKDLDGRESYVMTLATLEGTDGRKMSKSWGNAIWVEDTPAEMFGKIMSIRDDLIVQYFTLASNVPMETVVEVGKRLEASENPMVLKKELAREIVSELHSKEAAAKAQEEFEKTHQEGEFSGEPIPSPSRPYQTLVGTITEHGFSTSEAKRLINQGSVDVNGVTVNDRNIELNVGDEIKVGEKIFIKIV